MKKLLLLSVCVSAVVLTGCEKKNLTVYDYLVDQELMEEHMNKCNSGEWDRSGRECYAPFEAYQYSSAYNDGRLSEEDLKELGKK